MIMVNVIFRPWEVYKLYYTNFLKDPKNYFLGNVMCVGWTEMERWENGLIGVGIFSGFQYRLYSIPLSLGYTIDCAHFHNDRSSKRTCFTSLRDKERWMAWLSGRASALWIAVIETGGPKQYSWEILRVYRAENNN